VEGGGGVLKQQPELENTPSTNKIEIKVLTNGRHEDVFASSFSVAVVCAVDPSFIFIL